MTLNDATPSDRATRAGDPAHPTHLSVVQVVRSDAFAGVERYICQVANELVRRGHHVVAIGGDPGRMRTELRPEVAHRPATSVAQVAKALSGERTADMVHVHMTAAEAAAWLVRPVQRAPIVATRHFADERGSGTLAQLLTRVTSRPLSRDIAISQFVADSIEGPSVLLPTGVSDQPQAALDSQTVVMLQRLTPEKSPEVGLRAWSASGLGANGWRLVVAGAGELDGSLRRLADQLGITDSVDFAGLVTDTDRLLDESAVLLAPASAEPFGLSVVEAMAHGIPVVAAEGGAHVETVGEDGMLFAPGDADAAARALVALTGDLHLRRQVGRRLRDRQRARFSLPRHVDALEGLYRQVIAEAAARRR